MLYDYQNCIDFAVEKAAKENLEKGLAEGKIEARIETAKNLLKMGLTLSQISLATGLSESELTKINDFSLKK